MSPAHAFVCLEPVLQGKAPNDYILRGFDACCLEITELPAYVSTFRVPCLLRGANGCLLRGANLYGGFRLLLVPVSLAAKVAAVLDGRFHSLLADAFSGPWLHAFPYATSFLLVQVSVSSGSAKWILFRYCGFLVLQGNAFGLQLVGCVSCG